MAEELAKMKKTRGGHRRSVTKALHEVEALLTGERDVLKLSILRRVLTEKMLDWMRG